MTLEKAIEILEDGEWWDEVIMPTTEDNEAISKMHQALDIAISVMQNVLDARRFPNDKLCSICGDKFEPWEVRYGQIYVGHGKIQDKAVWHEGALYGLEGAQGWKEAGSRNASSILESGRG